MHFELLKGLINAAIVIVDEGSSFVKQQLNTQLTNIENREDTLSELEETKANAVALLDRLTNIIRPDASPSSSPEADLDEDDV
ncbi:hypothetical protein [Paenibacillus soyae]|uniref:Uncharacterized protein n=1 Tax=Paenibacillus soyae TaxID=2969249 RepID=A0A9X2MM68_9BACL|nr:hypothetical protein [Paenibacillus soyae]MCR2802607.1 hypothetical protein [Paenibacillus soyae]